MKTGRQPLGGRAARLQQGGASLIHFICVDCKRFMGRLYANQQRPHSGPFLLCEMVENQIQALRSTLNLVRGAFDSVWAPQGHL